MTKQVEQLEEPGSPKGIGAQTLLRGIDVICAVAEGHCALADLASAVGLSRSTTHRLASNLVDRRLLNFAPRAGYTLGPKLLELGHLASQQLNLASIAYPYLQDLAVLTGDTVHLGVRDGNEVLYLDKVNGSRRIQISSRIGERQPLRSTAVGKALLLDEPQSSLREIYLREAQSYPNYLLDDATWLGRMLQYAADGYAFDVEENEDRIRCVSAPIRDASNRIVASLSVSSAAQYMDDNRMSELAKHVVATGEAISAELGWKINRNL